MTVIIGLLAILVVGCGLVVLCFFSRSLPVLDGIVKVTGLPDSVEILRDELGVPTICGKNRLDVATGLGFCHAQDRYFQMDLMRRKASGEMAEILGKDGIQYDKSARRHMFRMHAQKTWNSMAAEDKVLITAYTDGVNAGFKALKGKPFEYHILHTEPRPWLPQDTILIIYALALDLQGRIADYKHMLSALENTFGANVLNYFIPCSTDWDAPLDGNQPCVNSVPPPSEINLRCPNFTQNCRLKSPLSLAAEDEDSEGRPLASNSYVISAGKSGNNAPILAGDMHTPLQVPNIWYRVQMDWPEQKFSGNLSLTGVTLPGFPFLISGSNGHVAWNFTNSAIDIMDFIKIEVSTTGKDSYIISGGNLESFQKFSEEIKVKGASSIDEEILWSKWGPIDSRSSPETLLTLRWALYESNAINLNIRHLETAKNIFEAFKAAKCTGGPPLNMLVADSMENIGWTIFGKLPRNGDAEQRLCRSSIEIADDRFGFLESDKYPEIINPPEGYLWTANNRTIANRSTFRSFRGMYDNTTRAMQIRNSLKYLKCATHESLLAIQLDDEALFFRRWQTLLLSILDESTCAGNKKRKKFRSHVKEWRGHAEVGSIGYFVIRSWRQNVAKSVFDPIAKACSIKHRHLKFLFSPLEQALWTLVTEKPFHMLNPKFGSWEELFLKAVDDIIYRNGKKKYQKCAWGEINKSKIAHPLSQHLPSFIRFLLDMPAVAIPGDMFMPRMHSPRFGASVRMIISPGREHEARFSMPCGQCAHPLSKFYRAGHNIWTKSKTLSLLPSKTKHRLVLSP